MRPIRVLVPSGVLGLGFDRDALAAGIAAQPDVIAIDGGSTDSGPHSLGTGTSKYSRAACKAEWRELLLAQQQLKVPLIIGSAGTCGTDSTVDWMLDITAELVSECNLSIEVACVYTEQSAETITTALSTGRLLPLAPEVPISQALISQCEHIVGLAGAEHIQAALQTGADVIIAGRTTDTAIISALPLLKGCNAGSAWHAAKIAECGALCSTHPTSGVIMVEISHDEGFVITPMAENARCTPQSVSAHMLYENADPFILYEPGGFLDVSDAHYEALSDYSVRVTGSVWQTTSPYTVKLEGARLAGYQTTLLALLRDSHYVSNATAWVERLSGFLERELEIAFGTANNNQDDKASPYTLDFRIIGENATLGALETCQHCGHELGVLVIITAQSQAMADEIAKFVNPFLLHYPLTDNEPLPTFAFPYSPSQSSRGALYEFCLNHVLQLDEPMTAVRMVSTRLSA